ncbi:MAG: cyclic nucleotide-binding domain-containing protein, partial [Tenuifilaceae bacterium]
MDNKEIIEFLKKIELFRGLTDDEYQMLMCCVEVKTYRAYQFLFRENGRRENIFIIYEGEVELFKSNPYGVEMKLTYFSKGDFLGEGSWDTETPHSTSARTLAPTTVLTLANEVFNKNATTTLKIFSNITRVISRRMRHANSRMINPAAQYESGRTRNEHDLLGNRDVPYEYYYGIQTLRALENFNISG